MPPDHPVRILWERLDSRGLEWAEVVPDGTGTRIDGVALVAWEDGPHRVEYRIDLDAGGCTRYLRLEARGPNARTIELDADGAGRWRRLPAGDVAVEALDEQAALDLDLGFSPVTNSLPIWRLGGSVAPGRPIEIRVAWILFPSWDVVEGRQTYTRLGADRWRYASGGFEADLEVGPDGLVVDYPGGWRAIARG